MDQGSVAGYGRNLLLKPTCFFWCKSHDHLSFFRRSEQKGDKFNIVIDNLLSRDNIGLIKINNQRKHDT
jgi:hypothetical protein